MKKVLVVYNTLKNGGVENVIMNITSNISKEGYQFDLVAFEKAETEIYNDRFRALGGTIYTVKQIKTGITIVDRLLNVMPKAYGIFKILKKNKYNAVHSHQSFESGLVMLVSYLAKVKVRITHSHFGGLKPGNKIDAIMRNFNRRLICNYATHKVACSENAYEWLYGENTDKKVIIYNGIDLEKFDGRKNDRKDNTINFINVGRYVESKNHTFLLDVFSELNKFRDNIKLTLVGYGELEEDVINKIKKLGLTDKVEMLPGNSNIVEVLRNQDYSIFPSKREGFSVSLVEFQAMKIPIFISSDITRESDLGICTFLNLNDSASSWAKSVNDYIEHDNGNRNVDLRKIDNKMIAKEIIEIYK